MTSIFFLLFVCHFFHISTNRFYALTFSIYRIKCCHHYIYTRERKKERMRRKMSYTLTGSMPSYQYLFCFYTKLYCSYNNRKKEKKSKSLFFPGICVCKPDFGYHLSHNLILKLVLIGFLSLYMFSCVFTLCMIFIVCVCVC